MIRRCIIAAVAVCCGCGAEPSEDSLAEVEPACLELDSSSNAVTHFHGGAAKLGVYDLQPALRSDAVRDGDLRRAWRSAPLHHVTLDGVDYPPLIYATPLVVDGVVFTATSNGWVYAMNAGSDTRCGSARGEVLWSNQLVTPAALERLDGGVPMGILSTPVLDTAADPPRMYAAAHDADLGWQMFALDLERGDVLPDWPVPINDAQLEPVNTNGPARFFEGPIMSQRGALVLSPGGDRVYAAFGTYWGQGTGWIVAVNTVEPSISAAFSSAPSTDPASNGGIWGSAGPSVDAEGRVWLTTGNAPPDSGTTAGVWGSSLLQLSAELDVESTYTPFNYCALDESNLDLGASQPLLLPPLVGSATPNLLAFGGKQGTVYLVDRDDMLEVASSRPTCSDDAANDRSLHGPEVQAQFGKPGPLNVFGPYSEEFGQIDHAKMRTKLAWWTNSAGKPFLFAAGSTKAAEDSTVSVAPSIAKIAVEVDPAAPAYLRLEAVNPDVVLVNPGSPVVSDVGSGDAVVWVLDRNAPRTAALLDPATPTPVLYAFDAETLELLWKSGEGALGPSGKYASPTVYDGVVYVGTDRIEAFEVSR